MIILCTTLKQNNPGKADSKTGMQVFPKGVTVDFVCIYH
jgi:hypothetical protein